MCIRDRPNTVPLSVLKSYSNYRRERFLLQKVLLVIILLFFCMVPLLFIAPNMQLNLKDHGTNGKPAYELVVDTFIPVSRITANIGGSNIPVYEVAEKTYSIEPTLNGTMTVTVTLKNRQFASITCEVSGVDTTSPVVLSDKQVGDQIYPVSYTHLDVYKRQDQMAALPYCPLALSGKRRNCRLVYRNLPVSYTHLDVYKRQSAFSSAPSMLAVLISKSPVSTVTA